MTEPSDRIPTETELGHQADAVDSWGIMRVGGVLVAIVIVSMVLMRTLLQYLELSAPTDGVQPTMPRDDQLPPRPWLDVDQSARLAEFRQAEDAELSTYRWVDQERGIAQIPIARAIEILAESSLPAREENAEQ